MTKQAQQSPLQVGMTAEVALCTGMALAELVEGSLPLDVGLENPPEPMRLIGPALLARGGGTVQAIAALAPLNRETDAGVLLRVLLEHMITFAWLSADSDHRRFGLWLKDDSKRRLTMHNDMPDGLPELLSPGLRDFFRGVVNTIDGAAPDLRTRALQADADWAPRLPDIMRPGYDWGSFLGLYRITYRYLSVFTHAGLLSLGAVTKRTEGGDRVEMETRGGARSAVRMAPLTFGLGLYVSSVATGWPEKQTIDAIFDEAAAG